MSNESSNVYKLRQPPTPPVYVEPEWQSRPQPPMPGGRERVKMGLWEPSEYAARLCDQLPSAAEFVPTPHFIDAMDDLHGMVCEALEKIGAPPLPRRAGGRPAKSFTARLSFFAGIWMEANATESVADLVRAMQAECDYRGWEIGDTRLREMATEFMEDFHALRRRG